MSAGHQIGEAPDGRFVRAIFEPSAGEVAAGALIEAHELLELIGRDGLQFARPLSQIAETCPRILVRRNERIDVHLRPTVVVS